MVRLSEDEWSAVQAAPPTSYSLGGSGLDRIATMEPRISDGLGHWWDSSIQDWVNGDGSRYDPAQSYASTPDYTDPFANFDASSPYNSGVGGGALDQINQQYQGGLDYQGDWAGGGVYTDPNSGSTPQSQNLWADGYWWNSRGELWDDTSQSWMSPQQYNDYRQQAYDYSNAQANPQFSPINYEQPGGWWQDYQAAQDRTNYNLQDQRLSDYIAPDEPKGGFWNGVKDAAGNVGSALASQPFVAGTRAIVDAVNPFIDEATGTTREQRINDQLSGNALVSDVTGGRVDLSQLPYGAGYVTDAALAPATYIGIGGTGAIGKEIAAGALGNIGAAFGASDTAEKIPYFGDQPAWLRALEAGGIASVGAYKGIGLGEGVVGELRNTTTPLPESIYKPSIFRVGDEAQFPPDVARQLPPGKAIPQLAGASDEALNPARRQLLDALDAERKFRESGQADTLIHEGRVTQAKGIGEATGNLGDSFTENAANIRAGARTGSMLPTTQGLKLDDSTLNQLLKEAVDYNGGKQFDNLRAVKALDKLNNGQRLQPGEIKALRQIYGDEIADAVAKTNPQRIQTIAELTPEDISKINRMAEVDGKKVATLEVQAQRQHELADDLVKQSRMDPTNPRLKKAAEDARARALKQQNDADRILADRAEQYTANLPQRTEAGIISGETSKLGSLDDALRRDKRLAAQEAAVRKAAEDDWVRSLDPQGPDEYALRQARYERNSERSLSAAQEAAKKAAGDKASAEWARALGYDQPDSYAKTFAGDQARAQRDLGRLQDRARAVQMQATNKEFYRASPEQAVTKAKDVVAKLDVPDSLKSQLIDTIELGSRRQAIVLDGMGDSGPGLLRKIYAGATGEVTDSYTSKLLTQRAFVENALESQGLSKETAKKIGKLLQDAELRQKYGDNIPEWVTKSLDEAKFNFGEGGAIKGLADISQELKNTQFGIGDMAVFGQQAAKAGLTNAPQIVTGYVNRALQALHLGGVNTAIPEAAIARDTQYALDGLALHSHGITDIVSNERTLISRLGPAGRLIDDKVALPAIKRLTDFQFDTVLGNLRKSIYEGNLVMAKMSGADIADPVVRQRAAEMANAATGAGKLAQKSARANAEKAFLLSPSMRRAQIQQWGQVIKGLAHQDTALSSAMAIMSSVGLTLAVGKLLSDYTGIPFETDPSKKEFGNIRIPGFGTVNPFSQEQIAKAFARSIRIVAEDQSPDAAKKVTEEWGKILVSSASPGVRPFLASVGVGIDQNGYHWGDMGQGQSFKQRALSAAPIPPLASSVIQRANKVGWKDAILSPQTALEGLGINSYPESQYDVRNRKAMDEYGKPYGQLSESEKFAFDQKNGKVLSSDPKIRQQQEQSAALIQQQADRQDARDAQLQQNGMTPDNWRLWRDQRKQDNLYFAGRFDQLYPGVNFTDKNVTDVDRYYKAIADNTDRVTGDVNWDAVDQATKGLDQAYIKANTNLRDTDTERVYHDAVSQIESTGYFEREKQAWQQVAALVPTWDKLGNPVNPSEYATYDEWRAAALKAGLELAGKTPSDVGTVTQIESWLDKQDPAKGVDYFTKQWKDEWVATNPREAYLAWQMGYYNPRKEIKDWLTRQFE